MSPSLDFVTISGGKSRLSFSACAVKLVPPQIVVTTVCCLFVSRILPALGPVVVIVHKYPRYWFHECYVDRGAFVTSGQSTSGFDHALLGRNRLALRHGCTTRPRDVGAMTDREVNQFHNFGGTVFLGLRAPTPKAQIVVPVVADPAAKSE